MPHIGLFIPCYIEQFYPQVGVATYELLKTLGYQISFPLHQTCCGQPLANSGYACESKKSVTQLLSRFEAYDYVVGPSASCVYHIRQHTASLLKDHKPLKNTAQKFLDLTEFIFSQNRQNDIQGFFDGRIALHKSCHGLRRLKLGKCSELMGKEENQQAVLLQQIEGIEIVTPQRADECCGFGGTFAVTQEVLSTRMGMDRLQDYLNAGAEILTSGDMSCLMHLDGLIKRNHLPLKTMHLAEILYQAVQQKQSSVKSSAYVQ
ncbi:(Fe-S)-binding protein [Algivirga pacifica]|uniref:(Fe-S)-binding protein n=1 Tax=Algivirga pacifica TaxID=1162670 RepID=A0ABP9DCD1_9BACT